MKNMEAKILPATEDTQKILKKHPGLEKNLDIEQCGFWPVTEIRNMDERRNKFWLSCR